MVLGLLLARRGVRVQVLELHADFERDFRGDTIHPSTMEMLDRIGAAEDLHRLRHGKLRAMRFVTPQRTWRLVELGRLKTRFPYIMIAPQARFLEFLHERARRYAHFSLVFQATVQELIEEDGVVKGVRYKDARGAVHDVRAPLTVAADGRGSRLARLAGLEPEPQAPEMDVIWLRLPKKVGDLPDGLGCRWLETKSRFWPDPRIRPDVGANGWCRLKLTRSNTRWDVGLTYVDWTGRERLHAALAREDGGTIRFEHVTESNMTAVGAPLTWSPVPEAE